MLNIAYIMGFIGVAVGILVGVFIFTEVETSVDCPDATTNPGGNAGCQKAKNLSWAVEFYRLQCSLVCLHCLVGSTNTDRQTTLFNII